MRNAARHGTKLSPPEERSAEIVRALDQMVDKVLGNLDARIREIVGQIEASAPNKRAEEHMQDVDKRFKDLTEEEQALRDDQREAARAFERIKERRCVRGVVERGRTPLCAFFFLPGADSGPLLVFAFFFSGADSEMLPSSSFAFFFLFLWC